MYNKLPNKASVRISRITAAGDRDIREVRFPEYGRS